MGELVEFDEGVETAWREFRQRLGDVLTALQRGEVIRVAAYAPAIGMAPPPWVRIRLVRNRLIANVPLPRGRAIEQHRWAAVQAYLEDSWWDAPVDGARARWQQVSWHLKTSRGYADWLAVQVIELLRDGFDVLHPSLLHAPARLWDTTPPTVPVAGARVPAPLPESEFSIAHEVRCREELQSLVLATLAPRFQQPLELDCDGDLPVVHGHTTTFVRVPQDSPTVELFAWPVVELRNEAAARTEVRILNRDYPIISFVLEEDRICARATVLAFPFVPRHLDDLLTSFTRLMDRICSDLADRVQGRRWHEWASNDTVDEERP